jgi:hypothetical protein
MAVFVTAISPAGSSQHEHIASVRWLDCGNSTAGTMSTSGAVAWLNKGNSLFVADEEGSVEVHVVNAATPYLRTVKDGRYTDNLLALPRF